MKKNKSVIILLIAMILLSITNILNIKIDGEVLKLSGISVIVGIIAYFVTRNSKTDGFNIKTIFKDFKNHPKAIVFSLLSFLSVILCTVIANKYIPEFNEHVNNRIDFATSSDLAKTILMLAVMTLGEEIAWRAFFQKKTTKMIKFIPSIILTSVLFALGHYSEGSFTIVAYDLLFVFIDSVTYGLVFKETDNAWCSWIAHLLADVLAIFLM